MDPAERHHRPETDENGTWLVDDFPVVGPFDVTVMPSEYNEFFRTDQSILPNRSPG
jgi:hypothetical protein